MSKTETIELACPRCQRRAPFAYYSSINATLEPELKGRLFDGSLSVFTCEGCGHRASVDHPTLYHDMEHGLMIQYDPTGLTDASAFQGLAGLIEGGSLRATRIVRSRAALIEKIFALGAGLDDRVLEVMKVVAAVHEPQLADATLLFEKLDGDELCLAARKGNDLFDARIPRSLYDQIQADLARHGLLPDAEPWSVVDHDFALALIERRG